MLVGNYNRKCKDSIGGVKAVWLLTWQHYNRSQIVTNGNILVSFPESFVYKFESLTIPNADEKMNENEGGKYYEQTISLTIQTNSKREFDKLLNKDYRALILDNNGLYRIFGLYNGMECDKIDFKTGGAKADLNGYNFTLTAKEEKQSVFILDPFDNGFIEDTFYILAQNSDIITSQNNDKLIYNG